ncbi:MAG: DMT family transporter [Deltaproteobacteria bacterium]|nr:DMT family transporter [Deltaproteobacteria bacterium]
MALWGGTWIAGRLLSQSLHPMTSALLRLALASSFLVGLYRFSRGRWPSLRKSEFLPVLFLALTGVFFYNRFFFTGLQTIPAGRAALIVACIPVCIAALSAVFWKERFGPVRILGTLISLVGVAVVIADGNPMVLLQGGVQTGDVYILGCVAAWAAYSLGGRSVMRTMEPLSAVTWSCLVGTFMLIPAAWGHVPSDLIRAGMVEWGCLVFLGTLATGVAYYWYYAAINTIGASRAGVFINLVPVFAVLMGFFLLDEPIHLSLLTGGVMVIGGVWLTNRP